MRALFLSTRALLLGGVFLLFSCIEPYKPEAISATQSYLVVDGFINSKGITTIKLSDTYDIAAKAAPPVETKASVYIEEEGGPRYTLQESAVKGTYTSASLVLNTARNYRLHIRTAAGKEYTSDFVPVKTTPPIDNVVGKAENTGLNLYVNTHDATGATQYYRWEYEETWEIIPIHHPAIEYAGGDIRPIAVPYPTRCWGNAHSTTIQISKSTALNRDIISNYPIRSLSTTSNLLFSKYSLLVQQHALTKEEYAYWELLRKNTENIGTLFDPLPAQLTGNIHCLNDVNEIALGYVGVHSLEEKRIFISRTDLPTTWRVSTGYESCVPDTLKLKGPTPVTLLLSNAFGQMHSLPILTIYSISGALIGYTYSTPDCIDCRTRGTAVRPSFWQ